MGGAKDNINCEDELCVIYRMSCESRSVYIGDTRRTAKVRAKEHQPQAHNGREQSAVVAHAWDGHTIN